MNKKAQTIFFAFMLGLVILLLILVFAGIVKERSDVARNTTIENGEPGLDCTNSSISDYNKAACYTTDLTTFYFIGGVLFLVGAIFSARFLFPNE